MHNDKLKQIIARQNERLEQEAVSRASEIINEIASYQQESLSTGKGYNENTFIPSAETMSALKAAVKLYKADVEKSIGLSAT